MSAPAPTHAVSRIRILGHPTSFDKHIDAVNKKHIWIILDIYSDTFGDLEPEVENQGGL